MIPYLELNLINLCLVKEEIRMLDDYVFVFGLSRRPDAQVSDDEKSYSPSDLTERTFQFHVSTRSFSAN